MPLQAGSPMLMRVLQVLDRGSRVGITMLQLHATGLGRRQRVVVYVRGRGRVLRECCSVVLRQVRTASFDLVAVRHGDRRVRAVLAAASRWPSDGSGLRLEELHCNISELGELLPELRELRGRASDFDPLELGEFQRCLKWHVDRAEVCCEGGGITVALADVHLAAALSLAVGEAVREHAVLLLRRLVEAVALRLPKLEVLGLDAEDRAHGHCGVDVVGLLCLLDRSHHGIDGRLPIVARPSCEERLVAIALSDRWCRGLVGLLGGAAAHLLEWFRGRGERVATAGCSFSLS
mmetsp:Transcript_146647/g.381151  ORF Transcript_146647/g.381151 Transcript_146647/m.381151 type:complete len:292 (-) Transcript_146647:12-887(-)